MLTIKSACGIDLSNKKIVLSVSRLVPKKGIKEFIENVMVDISKDVMNSLFLIAGDGPEMTKIKKLINALGLENKVFLAGCIKHNSAIYNAFFCVADVFIMPNVKRDDDAEGFGIVALEAGIRGVPVVAYDVDGIGEAIHNGENGILVTSGDIVSFKNQILRFFKNSLLKHEYNEKTKKYVTDNFGWDKIIKKYMEQYSELLNHNQQASSRK